MGASVARLATERLRLRCWHDDDRDAFAELNADPAVMADLGGPLGRDDSDRKLDRYAATFDAYGYGRWVIERQAGDPAEFIGYAGIMPVGEEHPLGRHDEIGWRLRREFWGHGFASEAASAALHDGLTHVGLTKILSYTAADNHRSQAVMGRLGLRRDQSLDFRAHYDGFGDWNGLVWVATGPGLTYRAGRQRSRVAVRRRAE